MSAFSLAVTAHLSPLNLDEDIVDYVSSLVDESDVHDDDTKESVLQFVLSSLENEDESEKVVDSLFTVLRGGSSSSSSTPTSASPPSSTRLLTSKVFMKTADEDLVHSMQIKTSISEFYDTQIQLSNEIPLSARLQRKEAQKKLRTEELEKNRLLEIEHEMNLAANATSTDDTQNVNDDYNDSIMTDVNLHNFNLPNKKGSGQDLLTDASVTLSCNRRYGFIGKNGCGKTTLLELIAARELKGINPRMSLLLVKQEIVGTETRVLDVVLKSDSKREGLLLFIAQAQCEKHPEKASAEQLKIAMEKLMVIDESQPEVTARKLLAGLGFTEGMMLEETKKLSGGWRMRVSLVCALFRSPDLLLLDEPTNHLDLEAVIWLTNYLETNFKGTLLVVSHDRAFLNRVVTDVIHFYRGQLTNYRGDIDSFEQVLDDNMKKQKRQFDVQEKNKAHMQKYIDDHAKPHENGVKASKQRKSRMKKMERVGMLAASEGRGKVKLSYGDVVEDVEEFKEDAEVVINLPDPGPLDHDIVKLERASFSYVNDVTKEENHLFDDVDFSIDINSKCAILGRNGCGKSTLIKLIVNKLQTTKGEVKINSRAKIEYLAQHQLEQLDPFSTPQATMLELYPGDGSTAHIQTLRNYLANFGLGGETIPSQKIMTMSGGQKCRLCLAAAMYRKPHLLILDEPTNHLDSESCNALIKSLREFKGAFIVVSHDEHLIANCCNNLFVVYDKKIETLKMAGKQGFEKYREDVIKGRR